MTLKDKKGKWKMPNCPFCRRKMNMLSPRNIFDHSIYRCTPCKMVWQLRDKSLDYEDLLESKA